MMAGTNQLQPLNNFTSENQISSNFLDKKVNAKKSNESYLYESTNKHAYAEKGTNLIKSFIEIYGV